jgi:hypothetical protein
MHPAGWSVYSLQAPDAPITGTCVSRYRPSAKQSVRRLLVIGLPCLCEDVGTQRLDFLRPN